MSSLTVVTGANGLVGANLVRELLARGARLRVVVRNDDPEALRGLDVERIQGDVRDLESLKTALRGAERVYHLAGQISIVGPMGGLLQATNVIGARNVGEAALACGVKRLLHMCSVHALRQAPLDQPIDETRARVQPGQAPAYDCSKAAGEAEIRRLIAKGLEAVIVHPSGIIGPFDFRPSRMGQVFLDLYQRKLPALVAGGFDWVDVRDVVAGAIAAMERGRCNESYILSGRWQSMAELGSMAAAVTDVAPPRFTSPHWLARAGAPLMEGWAHLTGQEPLYTREALAALGGNKRYLCDKAQRELGYRPRPTQESVCDTYRWFAANGRLPRALLARIEAAPQARPAA